MNRLIQALEEAANEMIPVLTTIKVLRAEGIEKYAFNDIHFEVQKFLDRIRCNEKLSTFLMRKDSDEAMVMEVGFSSHESVVAIIRELTHKASNVSRRHGIDTIEVMVADGMFSDLQAALDIKKVAKLIEAGTEWRTIEGQGWTEKEALDDAMQRDQEYHGTEEGYGGGYGSMREVERRKMVRKPKRAKRVKIQKATVRKGPVKKAYVLNKRWGFSNKGSAPVEQDRRLKTQYKTQGEALKNAKALVLEYGVELDINLEAFCVGDTHLATISPMGGQMGLWRFDVAFRS